MESPPLYRAPPAPAPRPPLAASSEGHLGSTNDSDDIYEQLPSEDSDGGGSGEALVPRPVRRPRPRTAPAQPPPPVSTFVKRNKLEPSVSDNFVRRDVDLDKFDNLWAGARRSNRETTGSMLPNSKNSQQQQQQQEAVYLANAFAMTLCDCFASYLMNPKAFWRSCAFEINQIPDICFEHDEENKSLSWRCTASSTTDRIRHSGEHAINSMLRKRGKETESPVEFCKKNWTEKLKTLKN